MADTVFEDKPAETAADIVASLVGEGKKFKTIEDLAKSVAFKDEHIARIEGENAQLKTEVTTSKTVAEQIKALTATKETPAPKPADQPVKAPEVDLNERIRAELQTLESTRVASANVQAVSETMVKQFGSAEKANEAVKAKAAELGVSVQFLQSTAAQSPSAFYSLVGLNAQALVAPQAPRSETRPESFRPNANQPAPGTYEAMRDQQGRLDPKKLMDPNYLRASMEAALKDPDKFFANQAA